MRIRLRSFFLAIPLAVAALALVGGLSSTVAPILTHALDAPREMLATAGLITRPAPTANPTPRPVPFSALAYVPPPSFLGQEGASGQVLPAGGWTLGELTLLFRAESPEIGGLAPEVEVARVGDDSSTIRISADQIETTTGDSLIAARVTLSGLAPGEYTWRARFVQTTTGRASDWVDPPESDRAFGVVGEVPTITRAYLDGGIARPNRPPLIGRKDKTPFRWEVTANPLASLDHYVYSLDRDEPAPAKPPADALPLAGDSRSLAVGERDDGWWYLHLWPVDRLGRVGKPATASVSILRNPPQVYDVVFRKWATTPPYQTLPIRFKLSQAADVSLSILPQSADGSVRTFNVGRQEADAEISLAWDGKDGLGKIVPPGNYRLRIHAVDDAGNPSDSNFEGLIISDKVIRVSLTKQEMTAFAGDRVELRTLVTTGGQELPTPVGDFEILDKSAPFTFRSPWPQGSPYWYPTATVQRAMLFSVKDQTFIHDNNWRTVFGPGTNGAGVPGSLYSGSHGCVNTPPAAMAQLFDWAQLGTPVIIQP